MGMTCGGHQVSRESSSPVTELLVRWREGDREALEFDLRTAVGWMGCVENAGRWFVEADGRDNYRDGSNTRYSLHPPANITPSSYGRLRRLLKA